VTVPLAAAAGCVPLVDEVFIELEDGDGRHRLLHEAEEGALYEILISQAGGLLRYRLGDRVCVTGKHRDVPILAFAGRAGRVTDITGEKLDEAWVAEAMNGIARNRSFYTLLPVLPERGQPYYCLLSDDLRRGLADEAEAALLGSLRYREARFLGQLDAVQAVQRTDMRRAVHDAFNVAGIKVGDIKDHALIAPLELARRIGAELFRDQDAPA
jgi:hypothetical protein